MIKEASFASLQLQDRKRGENFEGMLVWADPGRCIVQLGWDSGCIGQILAPIVWTMSSVWALAVPFVDLDPHVGSSTGVSLLPPGLGIGACHYFLLSLGLVKSCSCKSTQRSLHRRSIQPAS